MSIGLAFWILMLIWAVFGVAPGFPRGTTGSWPSFGSSLLLFILLFLLGWKVFGFVIQGG